MVTWLETDKATLYQISVAALTPNCRQSPKLNVQVKGRGSYEIAEGGQGCWLPNLWALIRIWKLDQKAKQKHTKLCSQVSYQDKDSWVNLELIFSLASEVLRLNIDS